MLSPSPETVCRVFNRKYLILDTISDGCIRLLSHQRLSQYQSATTSSFAALYTHRSTFYQIFLIPVYAPYRVRRRQTGLYRLKLPSAQCQLFHSNSLRTSYPQWAPRSRISLSLASRPWNYSKNWSNKKETKQKVRLDAHSAAEDGI